MLVFAQIVIGLIVIVLGIAWRTQQVEADKRKNNRPPGPIDLPLIGGIFQILFTAGLRGPHYLRGHRISEAYGPVAYVKGGNQQGALVESFEAVKEVLNSPDFVPRFPQHPRFKEHTLFQNLGLMWSEGEPHREMRKFTIKTLKTFGFGEPKAAEAFLQEELFECVRILEEQRTSGGNLVHMYHTFKIPTFNILWRVMAGSRFSHNDESINKLIHAVEDVSRINIGLDPEWAFPFLRFIPGMSPSRTKAPSFLICHNFFYDIMRERRAKGTFKESQVDFIDYFLKTIDEEKHDPNTMYSDDQFVITCVDLLFGGLDTTANSIEFAILYITKHPAIQRKVQAEIDSVVGRDRLPSVLDRTNLRYSEAVMLETLRTANIVPLNARTSSCDTTIAGYNIPENTGVGLNTTVVHNDKKIWGDPAAFRPERFLDANNNIINSDKIFPFGGGRRMCLGYTMARVMWLVFFTGLLQRYTFEPSLDHPEISEVPDQGVANTPKPYYAIVKPRPH